MSPGDFALCDRLREAYSRSIWQKMGYKYEKLSDQGQQNTHTYTCRRCSREGLFPAGTEWTLSWDVGQIRLLISISKVTFSGAQAFVVIPLRVRERKPTVVWLWYRYICFHLFPLQWVCLEIQCSFSIFCCCIYGLQKQNIKTFYCWLQFGLTND